MKSQEGPPEGPPEYKAFNTHLFLKTWPEVWPQDVQLENGIVLTEGNIIIRLCTDRNLSYKKAQTGLEFYAKPYMEALLSLKKASRMHRVVQLLRGAQREDQ